jgi:hypothetical protein
MKLKNWLFCISGIVYLSASSQGAAIIVPFKTRAYNEVENHYRVIYKRKELWPKEYEVSSSDTALHFYKTDTSLVLKNNIYYGSPSLILKNKKGDTIFCGLVYMEHIPDPVFTLDGRLRGGNVQSQTLKFLHGIVPLHELPSEYEGRPLSLRVYVDSFLVTVYIGNEQRDLVCTGPLFSREFHDIISKFQSPDKFKINTIYYRFNDRRRVFNPYDMTFVLVSGYNSFSDIYLNLVSELKYQRIKGSLNYDSLYKAYDIPNDRTNEIDVPESALCRLTNCNSHSDTCYTEYYIGTCINRELVSEYQFKGVHTYKKVYLSGKPIIEFGWDSNSITGHFILYYKNGIKRVEGFVTSCPDTTKEFYLRSGYIDPVTLEMGINEKYFEWYSCPDSIWKYYNPEGKLFMSREFNHGIRRTETMHKD